MPSLRAIRLNHLIGFSLATLIVLVFAARLAGALRAACAGDLAAAEAFGFNVVFPLGLALTLLAMGATRTVEGILIRLATMFQLIAIAMFPAFALQLLLGLPLAFLVVEFWEKYAPNPLRERVYGMALTRGGT